MPNDRNTLVALGIALAAWIAARNGFANGVKLVLSSVGTRAGSAGQKSVQDAYRLG
jgi:hypothetical protein